MHARKAVGHPLKLMLSMVGSAVVVVSQSVAGLLAVLLIGVAISAVFVAAQLWFLHPFLLPFVLPVFALYRLLRSPRAAP
jgi:hypothetical protein